MQDLDNFHPYLLQPHPTETFPGRIRRCPLRPSWHVKNALRKRNHLVSWLGGKETERKPKGTPCSNIVSVVYDLHETCMAMYARNMALESHKNSPSDLMDRSLVISTIRSELWLSFSSIQALHFLNTSNQKAVFISPEMQHCFVNEL